MGKEESRESLRNIIERHEKLIKEQDKISRELSDMGSILLTKTEDMSIQEKSKVLDQLSESQASFELFLKFKEEVEGE